MQLRKLSRIHAVLYGFGLLMLVVPCSSMVVCAGDRDDIGLNRRFYQTRGGMAAWFCLAGSCCV